MNSGTISTNIYVDYMQSHGEASRSNTGKVEVEGIESPHESFSLGIPTPKKLTSYKGKKKSPSEILLTFEPISVYFLVSLFFFSIYLMNIYFFLIVLSLLLVNIIHLSDTLFTRR
jgi:hypothetical protein